VSERLSFLFGVHNHQPVGNFESVVHEATVQAYDPFFRCLADVDGLAVTVHCSGGLLAWIREHARGTFDRLGALASAGRVELLTGGFYEPVLPMLPDWDKVGQVQALTEFLRREFGVRARGMWLAERVWEPQLPRVLAEAGVEFVLVDDQHFALVGHDPETLGGYYLTEEQGARLAVFPISRRLRYLVPFAEPVESVRYLAAREGAGAVTLVDDGEKFGVWPGTHALCYEERWLPRFFEALVAAPGLAVSTFSRYLDAAPASGRAYLPTASYTEMGEWSLPAAAGEELEEAAERLHALPDGERLVRLLRGGFWRGFLVKYPEVGDVYWRMLRLSRHVRDALAARPGDPALVEAREHLWRGQANDAYWHGVFGGCYLPHLRRAARSALAGAEQRLVAAAALPTRATEEADLDGDGHVEVRVRTAELAVTIEPAAGGSVTELVFFPAGMDLADVLARRREAYHRRLKDLDTAGPRPGAVRSIHDSVEAKETGLAALLAEDAFRRASLLDGLFPGGPSPLDALHPWDAARLALGAARMRHEVAESPTHAAVRLALDPVAALPLAVDKQVEIAHAGASVTARYRLRWSGSEILRARWAVQLNLTLTAGDAPGRYYRIPGQPSLGSRGRLESARDLAMVDEWLGAEVELRWSRPGDLGWAPVETVSLSESGFERIYQGSALLVAWPIEIAPGADWQVELSLACRQLAARA
jgi:alpha-amylase